MNHLRDVAADGDLEEHLRAHGMGDWIQAAHELKRARYFGRDDDAWGEYGVISDRRWGCGDWGGGDVQYQAVRRLLAKHLGLDERSLRRRFNDRDYWGVKPPTAAELALRSLCQDSPDKH